VPRADWAQRVREDDAAAVDRGHISAGSGEDCDSGAGMARRSPEGRRRLGALIALGAGFHPHMTGRENVYLNGAILGLHKSEIDAQFDEIVDFAGMVESVVLPAI